MIIKLYIKSIIWGIFILFICSISFSTDQEINYIFNILPPDKVFHTFLYFIFIIFLLHDLYKKIKRTKRLAIIAISIAFLYGLLIEIMQQYIFTYRTAEFFDLVSNLTGIFLGYGFYIIIIQKLIIHKKIVH